MKLITNFKIIIILSFFLLFFSKGVYPREGNEDMRTSIFNEKWLDAIISIETVDEKGNIKPKGTGFLIQTKDNHNVLVTASHVVRDENNKIYDKLQYRRSDIDGDRATITEEELLKAGAGNWFFSESHDLACRFFGWQTGKKGLTVIPIDSILKIDDLQPGAPLLVLGFPTGLRSDFYKKPLARRGMISRADENIIIETFVYPGNSGGPVVYVPVLRLGQGLNSSLVNEEKLVGVITNYIPYQDIAISPQTHRPRVIFEENSGLSEVIPAIEIINLISREDFKKQEDKFKNITQQ